MFDVTSIGIFDTEYSYKNLFKQLSIINEINAKTIVFTDLEDQTYDFFDPVGSEKLVELQKYFKYEIPKSYLEFLQLTNGLELLGDVRLYDARKSLRRPKTSFFLKTL